MAPPRPAADRVNGGEPEPHDAVGDAPASLFFNGHGGFTADGTEYVIHIEAAGDDARRPPLPWVNVIANPSAGVIASESGSFHSWSANSRENRLTPWSNDPVSDPHGEALEALAEVRRDTGLPVVTEVMDPRQVELVAEHADMLQIGARNMQNFTLLTEVGRVHRPVLLKRGMSATIADLLLAAEYIMNQGNMHVVLCERGIRTFETATRNTFDVAAIPVLKRETHLPVIADPSHAGGRRDLVPALTYAAIAAGADGVMIEVHPDPEQALSDGEQSLSFPEFTAMMERLEALAQLMDRPVDRETGALAAV